MPVPVTIPIKLMVPDHLMIRMRLEPILSVDVNLTGDGHGHGDSMCKWALNVRICAIAYSLSREPEI